MTSCARAVSGTVRLRPDFVSQKVDRESCRSFQGEADRFTKPATRIDQEHAQPVAVVAARTDGREQPRFFFRLEEPDASLPLFLATKLRQIVDIAHLARLPQQLAQGSHLSIDGCIAVTAFAQRADHRIKHFLREGAETLAAQYLADFSKKGPDIGLVRAFVPENADILRGQIAERVFLDQSFGPMIRRGVSEIVLEPDRKR